MVSFDPTMSRSLANAPHCLRCKTTALVPVASPDSISFYECPKCQRQFARKVDGALFFRWLHPISLLLYPVIFEEHPEQRCEEVAALFAKQESAERIDLIVQEIRLELDESTQQVRDILESRASEEELRNYLRCITERLGEHLEKTA
jgi:hypothetical protein